VKIDHFSNIANLTKKTELEKVELLAFYFLENKSQPEFTVPDMCSMIVGLGFAKPNSARLKQKIIKSPRFVKGSIRDYFRLSVKAIEVFRKQYPNLSESEEIISDDSLLPEVLFKEAKRGYLLKVAQQINASYENNMFDACALMMRRLLEILLIHCFESKNIQDQIKDEDGNYQNLKILINKAISKPEIQLSSDVKKDIDEFRELGNLSAHRVKYNCRRDDIRPIRLGYRAVIEELLYVAGLTQGKT
jgi:Domain of unknown function (DUF4145)